MLCAKCEGVRTCVCVRFYRVRDLCMYWCAWYPFSSYQLTYSVPSSSESKTNSNEKTPTPKKALPLVLERWHFLGDNDKSFWLMCEFCCVFCTFLWRVFSCNPLSRYSREGLYGEVAREVCRYWQYLQIYSCMRVGTLVAWKFVDNYFVVKIKKKNYSFTQLTTQGTNSAHHAISQSAVNPQFPSTT